MQKIKKLHWWTLVTLLLAGISGCIGQEGPNPKFSTYKANLVQGSSPNGRYIVVLKRNANAQNVAKSHGVAPAHLYNHALRGFSALLQPQAIQGLSHNPNVVLIQPDSVAKATAQTVPTGIMRMGAYDPNLTGVNVNVAVLDTGVDNSHPDLNVVGGYNFSGGPSKKWTDRNGHGTHVAGTIGALNNGIGVVGVAPGARIWAVKVLGDSGSGYTSDIIAGIDWVTANAATIKVANMSLSGPMSASSGDCVSDGNGGLVDPGDAEHTAICNAVAAGITFVVAAGNDSMDACLRSPAGYPEAITVSALADFDGQPGGNGSGSFAFSDCTENVDDSFACFSNYGVCVEIMAPGVGIYSTAPGGSYASKSGTSMAAPHVAGAAARYIADHPGATPAEVFAGLGKEPAPCGSGTSCGDDPDGDQEPLNVLDSTPECVIDGDCTAGSLCCNGSCSTPACLSDGDCGDGNACTTDTCTGAGTCSAACSNTPLADGTTCTGGLCCSGSCSAPACASDGDCGDGNACTTDTCTGAGTCSAACSNDALPDNTSCGTDSVCCSGACTAQTQCSSCSPLGASCSSAAECCSSKCKGKPGNLTCR